MRLSLLFLSVLLVIGCSKESTNGSSLSPQPPESKPQTPGSAGQNNQKVEISFQKFSIIREFGGNDNAALFGVLPNSRKFEVSKVVGPNFIKTYQVGFLTQSSIDKLFLNSSKPLSPAEKQDLLSKFSGATVIYAEGYAGNLCNLEEIKHEIVVSGKVDTTDVEIAFQFEALPNPRGNCEFHVFGIETRYTK